MASGTPPSARSPSTTRSRTVAAFRRMHAEIAGNITGAEPAQVQNGLASWASSSAPRPGGLAPLFESAVLSMRARVCPASVPPPSPLGGMPEALLRTRSPGRSGPGVPPVGMKASSAVWFAIVTDCPGRPTNAGRTPGWAVIHPSGPCVPEPLAMPLGAPYAPCVRVQSVPDAGQFGIGVWVQPLCGSQPSLVHGLPSSQSIATPLQAPCMHTSPRVQAFPSSQGMPSSGVCWQPSVGSQVSAVHGLPSSQSGGAAAWQAPATHTCGLHAVPVPFGMLQSLVAVHGTQPGMGASWHPSVGSQLAVKQAFGGLHASGVPGVQVPPSQASAPLHTLPSGHGVPSAAGRCWQPDVGSQRSSVQGFVSRQSSGTPGTQPPIALQVSRPLHTLPSEQDVPGGAKRQNPSQQLHGWPLAGPAAHYSPSSTMRSPHCWSAKVGPKSALNSSAMNRPVSDEKRPKRMSALQATTVAGTRLCWVKITAVPPTCTVTSAAPRPEPMIGPNVLLTFSLMLPATAIVAGAATRTRTWWPPLRLAKQYVPLPVRVSVAWSPITTAP